MGLLQEDPQAFLQSGSATGLDPAAIERYMTERAAAKAAKNWAQADAIRQALLSQGVVLKDSASGTTWERV